jgi:hypothetical protein
MRDNERFVGNYLIALGALSTISMILSVFVFNYMHLDPTGPLLIWAGIMLRKHSRLTRKLVTVIFTLVVLLIPALTLVLLFTGIGKVGVHLFGYPLHDPPKWLAILIMVVAVSVYFAVPVILLRRGARATDAAAA